MCFKVPKFVPILNSLIKLELVTNLMHTQVRYSNLLFYTVLIAKLTLKGRDVIKYRYIRIQYYTLISLIDRKVRFL